MTKEALDKAIDRARKDYAIAILKVKRLDLKIKLLFEKRYPEGRFHESFRVDSDTSIKR